VNPPISTESVEEVTKSQNSDISVQQVDDTDGNVTDDDRQVNDVTEILSLDDVLGLTTGSVDSKTSELRREQLEDETLAGAFDSAKHNKGGYLVKNGLLFHRAKISKTMSDWLCRKPDAKPYWNWLMKNWDAI